MLYNTNMGGVDHNDQLRGYYHVRLKCRKFYKYIFWSVFDVAIVVSFFVNTHPCHHRPEDLRRAGKESDW